MYGKKEFPKNKNQAFYPTGNTQIIACAKAYPELTFLVTAVGCGIAGYTSGEVAPLFRKATALANVYLPQVFWEGM